MRSMAAHFFQPGYFQSQRIVSYMADGQNLLCRFEIYFIPLCGKELLTTAWLQGRPSQKLMPEYDLELKTAD